MTKCDRNINRYCGSMGGPVAQFPSVVPRSFSANSYASTKSDEDLRELIQIASARSLCCKVDTEILRRRLLETEHSLKVVLRSSSVAIGRIDEDKSCDFEEDIKELNVDEILSSNLLPDEFEEFEASSSSSSENENNECDDQKLTRAQRKKVRKKKMKADALRRKGMIGPLMAAPDATEGDQPKVADKSDTKSDQPGELGPCTNQSKVKHRRRAKKLAKDNSSSSIVEKSQQNCVTNSDIIA